MRRRGRAALAAGAKEKATDTYLTLERRDTSDDDGETRPLAPIPALAPVPLLRPLVVCPPDFFAGSFAGSGEGSPARRRWWVMRRSGDAGLRDRGEQQLPTQMRAARLGGNALYTGPRGDAR